MSFEQVECEVILWRTVNGKKYLDEDGKPTRRVFLRRPDERGLSVGMRGTCTIHEYIATTGLTRIKHVSTLHTGRVLTIPLDVERDEPTHAEIIGMPVYRDPGEGGFDEEEFTRAEDLAISLKEMCRLRAVDEIAAEPAPAAPEVGPAPAPDGP